jgi:putative phosphoribosyl transferase
MRMFRDRDDAGRQLAEALKEKGYTNPLVLGIPRGGVVPAARVARFLEGDLGVVVARKLRAPLQPELAIGAVTPNGVAWIDESLAELTGADHAYLERERGTQTVEAARREAAFDGSRRPSMEGRTVIVVDDGIATGATALAAVRSVRASGARHVVMAVPVGPPHTLDKLRREADEVVALMEVEDFLAIGQFYIDFRQIDDAEVRRLLDAFEAERQSVHAPPVSDAPGARRA